MPARPLPGPVCVASARCTPVWPAIKGPLLTARIKLCEFVAILQIHPHIVAVIDNCHVGVQSGPRCRVEGGLQRMDVDTYQPLTQIIRCPDVVAVLVGTQTAWKPLCDPEWSVPCEIIRCEVAGLQKGIGIGGYRNLKRLASFDVAMSDYLTL